MKNNQKGITLISLVLTVALLLMFTGILIYSFKDSNNAIRLANMHTDIDNLREKITNYYLEKGEIPIISKLGLNELINQKLKSNQQDNPIGENDTENQFYIIDLKRIEGLTLNYGRDYEKIKSESVTSISQNEEDIYIINKDSHNIFYLKGIEVDGHTYYTNQAKDEEAVVLINN